MNFDWQGFVIEHGISYITAGKHSARGNIHIACPFCGVGAETMGLKLDRHEPFWGCWKDKAHAGRSPHRLITALLGCSYKDAEAIVARGDTSAIDEYEAAVGRVLSQPKNSIEPSPLTMPKEFHHLNRGRGAGPFLRYLEDREFEEADWVAMRYDLHYAQVGPFAWRLIIPIYFHEELVSWTARDITGRSQLRYRSLSEKPEAAKGQGGKVATVNMKDIVFNHDRAIRGGKTLVICEGPLDVIKLEYLADCAYMKAKEVRAVAVFGMPTDRQIGLLGLLKRKFARVLVALDVDAPGQNYGLVEALASGSATVHWATLPTGVKDPGELDLDTLKEFLYD